MSNILLQGLKMNMKLIRSNPKQHMDSYIGMVYLAYLKLQQKLYQCSVYEKLIEIQILMWFCSNCSIWCSNVLLAFRMPL